MPNNKKVFQIEINGLTQSIDAVKTLNTQLDNLEERIKKLQNSKIQIKVSGNADTASNTVVSGNSGGNSTRNQTNALQELSRLQQQVAKEQARNEALLTEEYQEQLRIKTQIQQANKEATKDIQQQATGVKDMNGEYANTLAGQRAYLSELKNALANTELGTDEWEKLGNEVLRVNTNVKQLEESYGVFTRNVGNYKSAAQGFKELADGTRQYENTLNGLNAKLNDLNDNLRNLDVGTEEYKKAQKEIAELKQRMNELQQGAETAGNAMEEKLGVKFTTVINGISYTFDDVNQGIGLLEDKLYSMAQAGDTSSKEFREISQEIARLRSNVLSVDSAIDQMIGTSKGLRNITSIFTGFAGIASLGQGLQGLFGGQNADLDESIQKFTSLSMVMQGVMAIQLEMNQNATAFGRLMNNVNGKIETFIGWLGKLPLLNVFPKMANDLKTVETSFNLADKAIELSEALGKSAMGVDGIKKAVDNLGSSMKNVLGQDWKNFFQTWQSFEGADLSGNQGLQDFMDAVDDARKNNADFAKSFDDVLKAESQAGEMSDALANSLGNLDTVVGRAAYRFPVLAKGIQLVATAMKTVARATIILALLEAVMWVVEKLTAGIGKLVDGFNKLTGNTGDVIDSSSLLEKQLERERQKFDELADSVDRAREAHENYQGIIDKMNDSIKGAGEQLGNFVEDLDKASALSNNLSKGNNWLSLGIGNAPDNIDEWIMQYNILQEAIQKGQDRVEAFEDAQRRAAEKGAEELEKFNNLSSGWGWWNTADDAMEDFANAQRAVINDLMNEINKINFDQPEQAMKDFTKVFDGEMGEIRRQALDNITNLFPEEAWAQNLKLLVENYESMIDSMKDKNEELAESTKQMSEEMARQLRDINTYNMQFEPGQWRFGYERQSLKDQYEDERKAAEGNAELLAAIDKKYYNDRNALIRKQAQEIQQVNFEIAQNELDAQKDSLDKRLKEIELSRQRELNAAKQGDINVQEQVASINKKYDAQILQEKENFYKRQVEAAEERNRELMQIEEQFLQQDLQAQRQLSQTQNATKGQQLENQNYSVTTTISYNVDTSGMEGVSERKAYYDQLLQVQRDYINEKEKLDLEEAKQNTAAQIEDNQVNYESQLQSLDDFYKERKKTLEQALDEEMVSQEQYNQELEQLEQMYLQREQQLQDQANQQQIALVQQGEAEQTRIMNEANQARLDANSEYLSQMTDSLNEYYDEINQTRNMTSRENVNQFGIINYKKEKENLQNTQKEYQNLLSNIDTQYTQLQTQLENKEISFNDFKQAKSELDGLKAKTEESLKATQSALDNLINTVAGSVMNMVNSYMGAFSDIWGMVSEWREMDLEEEERRLEAKQEMLDEELEAIEEQYEKQEEITQSHKDKINSIEGELSTARGDRRQALIDQLTKEREAQLQSLKTEQDIQKKKQQNEKKQQALEKQQEALEKKRWEQNKQNQIVQATINTFVAFSNAMSVQPWFLGLALSAVALALGMANVAKIKSQKYMATGGLLSGKSHLQGGIPVGNTGIEVEGNEYVINKRTTMKNLPLLEYINSRDKVLTRDDLIRFYDDGNGRQLISKPMVKKFEDGGQLPQGISQADLRRLINYQPETDTRPIVVSVVDIVNASDDLRQVQTLAGAV